MKSSGFCMGAFRGGAGFFLRASILLGAAVCLAAEENFELPEVELVESGVSTVRGEWLGAEALRSAPERTVDGILQKVPGFHLFRRTDSLVAHPTTQGASLGNAGPSAASRTALLLDGVPMNDPFGGWIPWSRFPPGWLSGVGLNPDGVSALPGAASPGGSILLQSRVFTDQPFTLFEVAAGNLLEHQVSLLSAQDLHSGRTRLFAGGFSTDYSGYPLVRGVRRGAVDVAAFSRVQGWDVGVRRFLDANGEWKLTLRSLGASETRGNGTPMTRNESFASDFSLRLERAASKEEWSGEWVVFHQERDFSSTFSSVAADRMSETPSLDQFGVPSSASGIVQRLRVPLSEEHVLLLGGDVRVLEGQTQERFRFVGGGFTRGREAGGRQQELGVLVVDNWTISKAWTTTGGVRLRLHRDDSGWLREKDLNGGAFLRSEALQGGVRAALDGGWAFTWKPEARWTLEGGVFSSRRYATLNELYRPYRVGDTVTIGNPGLRAEHLLGADAAARWEFSKGNALRARLFVSELRDAVANVSEVAGPGSFGDWGYLPAGTVGARRENLEAVRMRGIEGGLDSDFGVIGMLVVRWLYTGAEVARASVQPGLEGLRPAQLPRQQTTAALRGREEKWRWEVLGRWVSSQFDDDLNRRSLRGAITVDARLARRVASWAEVFFSVENVGNQKIEARVDPDGTVAYAAPRSYTIGVRSEF